MPEPDRWLSDYGRSHREILHPSLYWLAVLSLVPATAGLLWSLPIPQEFAETSPLLNWGTAFLMAVIVYYFIISLPLAIGMLPYVLATAALWLWMTGAGLSVAGASAGLMVASLAGLCVGHWGRGGIRATFADVQLMMIGPAWLLSRLYKRLGRRA
jgi:hypothetical protein